MAHWLMRVASALGIRVRSSPLALPAPQAPGGVVRSYAYPTRLEWYLGDIVAAMRSADQGVLRDAAHICESFRIDGRISGLIQTRTNGLLALPRHISGSRGDSRLVDELRSSYDEFLPAQELATLLADAIKLGSGIGELVNDARGLRLIRLLPEHVYVNPTTGEIRYNGELVTPGDGRWFYIARAELTPWRHGIWPALARPHISKDHAYFLREGYANKLANPARVAEAPVNATELDFQEWFEQVARWGVDTVFAMRPGYKVSLVESNGVGFQVFRETMQDADIDSTMAICGQMLTAEGGKGFVNMNIFQAIRNDLIHGDMLLLCTEIDRQLLPWWQREHALDLLEHSERLTVRYDTESPESKLARLNAKSLALDVSAKARAQGIEDTEVLKGAGLVRVSTEDDDAPEDTASSDIAAKMNTHNVARCEHSAINRCRKCGIERVRDFTLRADGSPEWHVIWRPIAKAAA